MFQYETILRGAMRVMYRTEQGETSNTLQAENKSGQNHHGKPSKRQKKPVGFVPLCVLVLVRLTPATRSDLILAIMFDHITV